MFKPAFFAQNRHKLKQLAKENLPIVLVANSFLQKSADEPYPFVQDSNFWYVTGIEEPETILVIDEAEEYIILPKRSEAQKAFDGEADVNELSAISGVKTVYDHQKGWEKLNAKLNRVSRVSVLEPAPVYIDFKSMFTNPSRAELIRRLREQNDGLEFVDLRQHFVSMRVVKCTEEVKAIEKAIEKTYELFRIIEKARKTAENENEIYVEIAKRVLPEGAEFAYEPIIAGGANATILHYKKNNHKFDSNGLLLVDTGVKFDHYCADLTRTIMGKPTDRFLAVHQAVLDVQEYALGLLKPGIALKDYEKDVRDYLGAKLMELGLINELSSESIRQFYPHSSGHFLGLDTHDVGDYDRPLEPGMVLTVEPGIYIKEENIGVRLEDNILITKNGCRNLSSRLLKSPSSFTIKPSHETKKTICSRAFYI